MSVLELKDMNFHSEWLYTYWPSSLTVCLKTNSPKLAMSLCFGFTSHHMSQIGMWTTQKFLTALQHLYCVYQWRTKTGVMLRIDTLYSHWHLVSVQGLLTYWGEHGIGIFQHGDANGLNLNKKSLLKQEMINTHTNLFSISCIMFLHLETYFTSYLTWSITQFNIVKYKHSTGGRIGDRDKL